MVSYFADSSAVVKRYVEESGSLWAKSLFTIDPQQTVVIIAITSVEVVAAITRRTRSGTISVEDAVPLAAANEANNLRVSVDLGSLIFLSVDNELNTAARAENLTVDNPNSQV